jgi:3-hydroxyisobutyrate dehydrogenase
VKVGFIGLGHQGAPIARRIARSGFELIACDISPQALAAFDEPDVRQSSDPLETARSVDVLMVCVRMDADLVALTADGALFEALGPDKACVIHSTVSPELCRQLDAQARRYGASILDAGVSGGGDAALAGQLSIFVGGEPTVFERVKAVLDSYGKSVVLLGPCGRGMEGKLLNNLVSIANYGLAAAILELGERLHFDRETLRQALLAGSADGFALRAIPNLLRPERGPWLYGILGKDLEHARALFAADDPTLAALLPAAESMIARLELLAQAGHAQGAEP